MTNEKRYTILTINPGSTSTKIGVFENESPLFETAVKHSIKKLEEIGQIWDQYTFRKDEIIAELEQRQVDLRKLDAIVARGGLIKPIPSGVYSIDEKMIEDARIGYQGEHASNLGCVIAYGIGWEFSIPAYIVDPPAVDDFEPLARVSGSAEFDRNSLFHALNIFSTARRFARERKTKLQDLNLIVAHLGGGITVAALRQGKAINVNNGLGEGPFTPDRTGGLPLMRFMDLCLSGEYDRTQLKKMVAGKGGLVSYFNTNNATDVENMIKTGNERFRLVYEAMAYQIAEEIGARATDLKGEVDGVILTGGLAYSDMLTGWIEDRVGFIGEVFKYPGENELQALAMGGLRVLREGETAKCYSITGKKVGVCYWTSVDEYDRAITIIEDTFKENGYHIRTANSNMEIIYKNCQASEELVGEAVKSFQQAKVDLIFAVGSPVSAIIKRFLRGLDVPVVCLGVYNPTVLGFLDLDEHDNLYAACYAVDIKEQFKNTIGCISPEIKKLGLMYKAGELQSEIQHDEIRNLTSKLNIKLVAHDVQSEEEFPKVLDLLQDEEVDWLILEADTMVANASRASIETFAHRIPTMCLLENTINRGGLIGYVASWDDVCRNGASLALQLFEGVSDREKITRPAKRKLLVNKETAARLKLLDSIKQTIRTVTFV